MNASVRALYIDDDPDSMAGTASALERRGDWLSVATAGSAGEGVDRLESEEFDVVILRTDSSDPRENVLLETIHAADLPLVRFTGENTITTWNPSDSGGYRSDSETKTDEYGTLTTHIRDAVVNGRDGVAGTPSVQFEKLIEHSSDMVCILDADGTFEYVSSSVERILGYPPSDLVGTNAFGLIHPDDRDRMIEAFDAIVEDPTREPQVECRIEHATDTWRTLDAKGRNLLTDPDVRGVVVNARDVTERVQMRRDLEAQATKIEALHEVATDLETCETEPAVCELAVDAAERILELHLCYVGIVEDDVITPKAWSSHAGPDYVSPMAVDEGLAGKTFQAGRSYLVEDVDQDDVSKPVREEYRSAISVPIGDIGVFQAVSTEPGGFDEADVELAELLVSHVAEALRRIRSIREIRRERNQFSALFENVPAPTVNYEIQDGEPYVLRVNRAFEETFGYDAEKVVDRTVDEFIVPSDEADEATELNRRVAAGRQLDLEVTRETADSTCRDFKLINAPIPEGPASHGYAIYVDITERKERERILETLHAATRDLMVVETRQEIAETVSETASDILGMPINGVHLYDSQAGGLAPVAISSANRDVLGNPPIFGSGEGIAWQVFETGDPHLTGDIREIPGIYNPNTPIRSEFHLPLGEHGVFIVSSTNTDDFDETDVSLAQILAANATVAFERVEHEQKLHRQADQMEFFNSILRHDVLNGMTVIRGQAELLAGNLDSDQRQDMETIIDWSNDVIEIVQRVQSVIETVTGQGDHHLETIDLAAVLHSEVDRIQSTYPEVTFETDVPSDVPVQANELLGEVLGNVITNAINHNDTNGLRLVVAVEIERDDDGGTVTVRIADNGRGIPDNRKETVFRRNETGPAKSSGTGFGLFFVHSMVETYGGDVWVKDNDSGGATFIIGLPLAEATTPGY